MNQPPEFDEKTARRVEEVYSSADEVGQRNFVMKALGASPGERVIDIGSGPGYVLSDIAGAVGPAGKAVGVDSSEAMFGLARKRCAGFKQVDLREGDALALPAGDGEFDAAVITQVYEPGFPRWIRDFPPFRLATVYNSTS